MGNQFIAYIQQLELMAFFSAYPLLYALVVLASGMFGRRNQTLRTIDNRLPLAYALTGTLYLGLQVKNLYQLHAVGFMRQYMLHPFLTSWGLIAVLFWIPLFRRKKEVSLLHSLVFFFFLVKDTYYEAFGSSADSDMFHNDMRIFTISLLMNLGAFLIVTTASYFLTSPEPGASSSK